MKEVVDIDIGFSYTQGTYKLVKDKTYMSQIKKKGRVMQRQLSITVRNMQGTSPCSASSLGFRFLVALALPQCSLPPAWQTSFLLSPSPSISEQPELFHFISLHFRSTHPNLVKSVLYIHLWEYEGAFLLSPRWRALI